jgi:phosphoglycolate phosphatase-like HAD superfamily hydrolase
MKYICIWRDNCNVIQATEFTSDSDGQAVSGLVERCRAEYVISDSAKISSPLLVVPEILIREDFSRFRLGVVTAENSHEITGAFKID